MNRIRSWIVSTIFGKAQSVAPGDGLVREDHPGWKVGDDVVCIPAGDGWVYINKEAAEHVGIDLLGQLNQRYRKERP